MGPTLWGWLDYSFPTPYSSSLPQLLHIAVRFTLHIAKVCNEVWLHPNSLHVHLLNSIILYSTSPFRTHHSLCTNGVGQSTRCGFGYHFRQWDVCEFISRWPRMVYWRAAVLTHQDGQFRFVILGWARSLELCLLMVELLLGGGDCIANRQHTWVTNIE